MAHAESLSIIPGGAEAAVRGILSCLGQPDSALATPRTQARAANAASRWMAGSVQFGSKCAIFIEGDPAETVYEVLDGVVTLYRLTCDGRRQVIGFAYPGELIGLSTRDHYTHGAQSAERVRLLAMPRARFNGMVAAVPALEGRLLSAIGLDLRRAQEHILLLGRKNALEKLCSFLLDIAERSGNGDGDSRVVRLPMSRSDIADYLGLTGETISRTFSALRARRVIRLRSVGEVEILDSGTLADFAEGDDQPLAA